MTDVEVTRVIQAPREQVFAAFLQETEIMEHFVPTGPGGHRMKIVLHRFEPRVGGAMEYSMVAAGAEPSGHKIVGTYTAIDDGDRIVRTEAPAMPDGSAGPETTVTFLFEDVAGGTQLTIRHEGIPDPQWAEGAKHGWASALENLALAYQEIA